MKKYIKFSFSTAFLLIAVLSGLSAQSCTSVNQLSLLVETPTDGANVRTNIIEVSGSVSNPQALVAIDGRNVPVTSNGSYSSFLELDEGSNKVIITATLGDTMTERVLNVGFLPAVAVYLFSPELEQFQQSMTVIPVMVEGYVFPRQSSVKVNNMPVLVDDKGFFSQAQAVQWIPDGNIIIRATAELDGMEDATTFTILLQDGKATIPPGQNLSFLSKFESPKAFTAEVGTSATIPLTLDIRKDHKGPAELRLKAVHVTKEYDNTESTLPEGMSVSILPPRVNVYPNTQYTVSLLLENEEYVRPGDYWFLITAVDKDDNVIHSAGWTKVTLVE